MILIIGIIVLFVVLGAVLMAGKGSFLIAGYNTMPKEEKAKYDEKAVCRFMGKMMFFFAFAMLFQLADYFYPGKNLGIVTTILIPAGAIFTVAYGNFSRSLRSGK